MKDPRNHVLRGQPLRLAAEQVNSLNSLMRVNTGFNSGPVDIPQAAKNVILCRNSSGADVDRWGVLEISGVVFDPGDGASAEATFQSTPCLTGGLPQGPAYRKQFVIAIEPIASNSIGRVAVDGVVQCKLNVTNESDRTAHSTSGSTAELTTGVGGAAEILWKQPGTGSGKWAVVRLGDAGIEIILCKAEADLELNGMYELQVWSESEDGQPEIVAGRTIHAQNRLYDISAGSWVLVAKTSVLLPDTGVNNWTMIAASDQYDGMYPEAPYAGYQCSTPTIGGRDLSALPGYDAEKKQALTHNNGCLVWIDLEDCQP
jgi:hypothetical protein